MRDVPAPMTETSVVVLLVAVLVTVVRVV